MRSAAQGRGTGHAVHGDRVSLAHRSPRGRSHRRGGRPTGSVPDEEVHTIPSSRGRRWKSGCCARSGSADAVREPAQQRSGLLRHAVVGPPGPPLSVFGMFKAQPGHGRRGTSLVRRLAQADRGPLRALTGRAPRMLRRPPPGDELITAFGALRQRRRPNGGCGCVVARAPRVPGGVRSVI
jgi:hypothetical protein